MQASQLKLLLLALVVALGLSGCATKIRADVTRFHELTPPEGRTFTVEALDPAKKGGIELKQYANLVSFYLEREGFRRSFGESPDLIVKIDYYISGPIQQTRRESYPGPYYGGFYPFFHHGFHHGHFSHFGYGFYGYPYYYPYYYTYTVYDVTLVMRIERPDGKVAFEGQAGGFSRERILNDVVPVLIEAMFTGFPGQSGETITVKLPVSGKGGAY